MHQFLIHQRDDHVGVAIEDVAGGRRAQAVYLDDGGTIEFDVAAGVPLGHKVAVRACAPGGTVLKYGTPIGVAPQGFGVGDYVHTHNLRSARW
jgi:(2R)-sulfolactate sulfo-lyase subunit alpha